MKQSIVFICLTLLITYTSYGQEKKGVQREGSHQTEANSDGQPGERAAEIESRSTGSSDSTGTNVGGQDNFANGNNSPSNVSSPTTTKTTSSAGSPGVLITDDEQPDGTNTMQRATLNIAGSPLPGSKKATTNKPDVPENKKFSAKEQSSFPVEKKSELKTTPPEKSTTK